MKDYDLYQTFLALLVVAAAIPQGTQSTTSCGRKWLDRAWRWLEITLRESFWSSNDARLRLR